MIQDKMRNKESIGPGSGAISSSDGKLFHASYSFKKCLSQKITSEKVMSISGINMIKRVVIKHVELMAVC